MRAFSETLTTLKRNLPERFRRKKTPEREDNAYICFDRRVGAIVAEANPMGKSRFIIQFYDEAYEGKSIEELCKAPVSAISGISESDALVLKTAFRIKTVSDLATNKYVKLAQGIDSLSEYSIRIHNETFESKAFEDLARKPVSAISGISVEDCALLKRIFGIDTIRELARNKYVQIAQTTVAMASMLRILRAAGVL